MKESTYLKKGLELMKQERFEEAIESFINDEKINPNNPFIFGSKGRSYFYLNKFDEALAAFNNAIKLKPDFANFYFFKGYTFYFQQKYKEAISEFENAIKQDPEKSKFYFCKANALIGLNKFDKAIFYYFQGMKIDPKNSDEILDYVFDLLLNENEIDMKFDFKKIVKSEIKELANENLMLRKKIEEMENNNCQIRKSIEIYLEKLKYVPKYDPIIIETPTFNIENTIKSLKDLIITEDLIVSDKPKIDFHICKICYSLVREPISCNDCDEIFCLYCVEESKKSNNKCPHCRKTFNERKLNKFNKNIINELIIECPFDCRNKIQYEFFTKHLENCGNIPKIYNCKLCKKSLNTENKGLDLIEMHKQTCEKIVLKCGNCDNKVNNGDWELHNKNCEKRISKCLKCSRVVLDKFINEHIQNDCKLFCEVVNVLKVVLKKI